MAISSDAITGFIGVVTGSAITGGFQLYLAMRNERRDHRAAVRRVAVELLNAQAMSNYAKVNPGQWRRLAEQMETDAWDKYADDLARDPRVEFGIIAGGYKGAQGIQAISAMRPPTDPFLNDAVDAIGKAVDHLQRLNKPKLRVLRRRPSSADG